MFNCAAYRNDAHSIVPDCPDKINRRSGCTDTQKGAKSVQVTAWIWDSVQTTSLFLHPGPGRQAGRARGIASFSRMCMLAGFLCELIENLHAQNELRGYFHGFAATKPQDRNSRFAKNAVLSMQILNKLAAHWPKHADKQKARRHRRIRDAFLAHRSPANRPRKKNEIVAPGPTARVYIDKL